jgi:hypothetical protein
MQITRDHAMSDRELKTSATNLGLKSGSGIIDLQNLGKFGDFGQVGRDLGVHDSRKMRRVRILTRED